ncbi:MAG: hypothetical protein GY703_03415 [Gammaproteobacteria bacterium]|nr:hypothetical protein [Gammaproteobacteria bacterium]
MKTLLRSISGVLAALSLLLVIVRMQAISDMGSATIKEVLGLIFPLSVFLLFGYIAIKGRMPFTS